MMNMSFPTRLAAICAVVVAPAALGSGLPISDLLLDFDHDANGAEIVHGQVIDDEYAAWGVSIDVQHPTDPALDFGVALATDVSLEADMRTGPENGAYHATNTTFLGNVLITPRNGVDGNNDGIIDVPDTAFERPNGVFIFTFADALYDSGSVMILDAEEAGGTIETRYQGSVLSTTTIPALGDNAVVTVNFPGANNNGQSEPQLFDQVVIRLAGSGGVNDLTVHAVPEPASAAALTLLAAGLIRRRR